MDTVSMLARILATLDNREWQQLELFVRSPYHNREARLLELYTYYREGARQSPEEIHALLYPAKAFTRRRWLATQGRFLQVVEAFIWTEKYRSSSAQLLPLQVEALAERQLVDASVALARVGQAAEPWSQLPAWEAAHFRREMYRFVYHTPPYSNRQNDLNGFMDNLQLEYLLLRLRYAVEKMARGLTYNEVEKGIEALLPEIERLQSAHPLLAFYYQFYQVHQQANELRASSLLALEAQYMDLYEELHPIDQGYWLIKLVNLFSQAIALNLPGFMVHLFRLMRFGADERLNLSNGRIKEVSFLNLINMGVNVGELAWVQQFRQDFLPLLSVADTYNAACISQAYLHYGAEEYREVYEELSALRKPSLIHQLYARPLELKSFLYRYLADNSLLGLFRSRLNTFYRWVYRDRRLSDTRKEEFLHFIKALRAFIHVTEKRLPSTAARQYVMHILEHSPRMSSPEWLRNMSKLL